MRRAAAMASVAAFFALGIGAAEAQQSYHVNGPLKLTVRARNFLDAGNTVQPYSQINPASAYGQTVSYLLNPPYANFRDRFGEGTLPDPIGGPFIGASNPIGPIDYNGYFDYPLN